MSFSSCLGAILLLTIASVVAIEPFGSSMVSRRATLSTHLRRRVGTAPTDCVTIQATIAALQDMLTDPTCDALCSRQITPQIQNAEIELQAVCATSVTCPVGTWLGFTPGVIMFGDFEAPSADVEDSLFAKGNIVLTAYSVGFKFDGAGPSLVAGKNLSFASGNIKHGNIVYGEESDIHTTVLHGLVQGQVVVKDAAFFDWTEVEAYFMYVEKYLKHFTGNTVSGSYLRGPTHAISCDTLDELHILTLDADGAPMIVVNVVGDECRISNLGINSKAGCENTIFSFDATSLYISEVSIPGMVLAPYADIVGMSGVITGQVIAKSFTGSTQFNKCVLTGCPAFLH